MKHNAFTALSLAAALVVAGSAQATPEFSINFENNYALTAQNGWTVQTGNVSDVAEVADAPSPAPTGFTLDNKVLSLDTGDEELNYAPTSQNVTILEMDVCFVGADSAPDTNGFSGQTMLYLDISGENPAVKAYTAGSGWVTLSGSVTDGSWHKVRMEFSASSVAFFLDGNGTAAGTATLSNFTKVTSVGFMGTGMVDNFVGDKAAPAIETDVNGSDVTTATAEVTAQGLVVNFGSQSGIQYIRVYDDQGKSVTLRTNSASATIDLSKLPGNVTRVDAVTSLDGLIPSGTSAAAESVTVDTSTSTPTIKIAVADLVSGLHYKVVDATSGQVLTTSKLVAPEEDGIDYTFEIPVATGNWAVKKFKIVISDDMPAPASGN